jgi:hypothetical protein
MQSRFLNSRIESTLTLVVSGLSVAFIAVGTLGLARPAGATPEAAVAVAAPLELERVVITGKRAPAKAATVAEARSPQQGT